jgi:hypothetical protein
MDLVDKNHMARGRVPSYKHCNGSCPGADALQTLWTRTPSLVIGPWGLLLGSMAQLA